MRWIALMCLVVCTTQLCAQAPESLTNSGWQEIRTSIAADRRRVSQVEPGICEAVTTDGLAARIDNDGLSMRGFVSDAGDGEMRLNLQRLNGRDVLHGGATANGERVLLDRGSCTEWFHNTESGLMHGFSVPTAPDASQRLEFDLLLQSGLVGELLADGRSMVLQRDGQALIGYRGLTAWDAGGLVLEAWLELTGEHLHIFVATHDAAYPVTVDPLISGEQQKLTAGDAAADDVFGVSVAVSGDTAVIGAYADDDGGTDSGSAYVFVRSGTTWTQQQKLTASDAAAGDYFGIFVAVSGDSAVIGAPQDDDGGTDSGSTYVFARSGTTWTQQQKLTASDAAAGDVFGVSVAVSGDTAVIGARQDDDGGTDSGSAYVFARSGTTWTQQQKLTASDAAAGDRFGFAVAVSGDTAVIGAPQDDDGGTDSGSAYVFLRSGTTWTQQQKLTASDAAADDIFGLAVAVSGDTAVIGTPQDDDGGTDSGSAYVFARSGTTWTQQQKLTASDAAADDIFGLAVAVSGDTAVIGAYADDDGGTDSGSAYVLVRSGTTWTQQQKLTASDAAAGDVFGYAVAMSGDTVVIGTPQDDDGGTNSGSAYVLVPFESADDFYVVAENGVLVVSASQGVLANDLGLGGGTTSASIQTFQNPSAQGGAVSLSSDGSFSYTPPATFVGTDTFTYGLSVNGSTVVDTRTVNIIVIAFNDAPVLTPPAPQTTGYQTALTLGSGTSNAVTVADPDAGSAVVELDILATGGTFTLAGTTGITITAGADGTAAMTLEGTLTDLNTAFDGASYTPGSSFSGLGSIRFIADDLGNTGGGGAMTATATLVILVNAPSSGGSGGGGDDESKCSTDTGSRPGFVLLLGLLSLVALSFRIRGSKA